MIFDTHVHLNDEKIYENLHRFLKEANENDVTKFLCIGYDLESSKLAIKIANEFDCVYAAIGVIPTEHEKYFLENKTTINELEKLLSTSNKIIAIGEIGLDYYWEKTPEIVEKQKKMFIEQIELANKYNLPVSIHARDSLQDTYDILKNHKVIKSGIMHCYSGSLEMAREFIKLGYKIAFGGVLTFKNSKETKRVLQNIELEHIVFETDAPYLAPTPNRGKMNEPKFIVETIKFAADFLNLDINYLKKLSFANSLKILGLKNEEN